MATARGSSRREATAKSAVSDQISQSVQSTSNLLLLMRQSSPSQEASDATLWRFDRSFSNTTDRLSKLPKRLLGKTDTIKKTGQVLERLPMVISSLDFHMENALNSALHLETVIQLLANKESSQHSSSSVAQASHSS